MEYSRRHDTKGQSSKVNFKALIAVPIILLVVLCVAKWWTDNDGRPFDAVAATANDGYRIYEEDVSKDIATYRKTLGLQSDKKWGQWLANNGYKSVDDIRSSEIDSIMQVHVMESECKRLHCMPSGSDVTKAVNDYKGTSGLTDRQWEKSIKQQGYDDTTYRQHIRESLMYQNLLEKLTSDDKDGGLDSDTLITNIHEQSSEFQHARKVSCIVMRTDEQGTMDRIAKVLEKQPERFDSYKRKYGETTQLDGWTVTNDMASELGDSVKGLDKYAVSGVIRLSTSNLLVIVRVDDAVDTDDEITSLSQLPDSLVKGVQDELSYSGRQEALEEHLQSVEKGLGIKKNDAKDLTKLPYYTKVPDLASASGTSSSDEGNQNGNVSLQQRLQSSITPSDGTNDSDTNLE
jgi:foldase protein PrsA